MKQLNCKLTALFAASLLAACGGGGGGGSSPAPAPAPAEQPVAVTAVTAPAVTAGDCARLTNEAASIAAVDLTNANIKTVNDYVLQVDPAHAYKVFVRRPADFVNWIANTGGVINLLTLGTAAHETLHMTDTVLRQCATAGDYKVLLHGTIYSTGLAAGDTSSIQIIDPLVPAGLKTEARYTTYITNAAGGNDFTVLLDELAAYAGGAHTEVQMVATGKTGGMTGALDANLGGTVNFMVYLQYYLQAARLNQPATYANIQGDPTTLAAIQAMWTRAEQALRDAYPYTNVAAAPRLVVSTDYVDAAYSAPLLAELDLLGITHATRASWSGTYLP